MALRRTWFILCVISTLVFVFSSGYEVDPQIAASIAEGEELMREIDEFLEDPAVPQNVKVGCLKNRHTEKNITVKFTVLIGKVIFSAELTCLMLLFNCINQ